MALARKIETAGLTYEEFALKLPNAVLSSGYSSTREYVAFNVHRKVSVRCPPEKWES